MNLSEVPEGSRFLDVDSIPVVMLPTGRCIAFSLNDGSSREYPNESKAGLEGDEMSAADFGAWVKAGFGVFPARSS